MTSRCNEDSCDLNVQQSKNSSTISTEVKHLGVLTSHNWRTFRWNIFWNLEQVHNLDDWDPPQTHVLFSDSFRPQQTSLLFVSYFLFLCLCPLRPTRRCLKETSTWRAPVRGGLSSWLCCQSPLGQVSMWAWLWRSSPTCPRTTTGSPVVREGNPPPAPRLHLESLVWRSGRGDKVQEETFVFTWSPHWSGSCDRQVTRSLEEPESFTPIRSQEEELKSSSLSLVYCWRTFPVGLLNIFI